MTPEEQNEVQHLIRAIPELAGCKDKPQRLGGLTNRVYALGDYVLRIPGKGTEEYINRSHEVVMAKEAAAAGVSPQVIHADAKSGIMVTRRVLGSTMSPERFKTAEKSVARAGQVLAKLHSAGRRFPSRFELFAVMEDYYRILTTKNFVLPAGYREAMREAENIRDALVKSPAPLVASHCDPLCENFLDDGSRMWIVDWEYGGMNDPMWDLGDLSVEGAFTPQQDEELIHAYFGGAASASDFGRLVIYKAMCDLLWALWGLIQYANKNPAEDFSAYAANRFNRCKALMATPEFSRHIATVAA